MCVVFLLDFINFIVIRVLIKDEKTFPTKTYLFKKLVLTNILNN